MIARSCGVNSILVLSGNRKISNEAMRCICKDSLSLIFRQVCGARIGNHKIAVYRFVTMQCVITPYEKPPLRCIRNSAWRIKNTELKILTQFCFFFGRCVGFSIPTSNCFVGFVSCRKHCEVSANNQREVFRIKTRVSRLNFTVLLQACCRFLVQNFDHANFESVVCPALQKSLLRSPENVLSG